MRAAERVATCHLCFAHPEQKKRHCFARHPQKKTILKFTIYHATATRTMLISYRVAAFEIA
jgi:histidinol phosphatase-like enzyme